ncbi:hypothetical protein ACWCHM_15710 [Micromonospora sp. SCSIO 07396]
MPFDAVIADQLMSAVAFDADDLPGSALAMYDANLRDSLLVRLPTWLRLERQPTGSLGRAVDHEPKLAAIARAQAAGRVRPGDPFDLFTLVLSRRSHGRRPASATPRPPTNPTRSTSGGAGSWPRASGARSHRAPRRRTDPGHPGSLVSGPSSS